MSATWKNRWKITGVLTTTRPLHIGDGRLREDERVTYKVGRGEAKKEKKAKVATVATDCDGKPYLPGSTLKGNLRAWLEANGAPTAAMDALFGTRDAGASNAVGGKCEFHNGRYKPSNPTREPPHWCPDRRTGLRAGVAIDRVTGTARDKKLFHHEFVPAGTEFAVTVTAQDLEEDEVRVLLGALDGFNAVGRAPVVLGAATGDGWGQFTWQRGDVLKVTSADVEKWLQDDDAGIGADLEGTAQNLTPWAPPAPPAGSRVVVDLTLQFDGPFLVNDPSRCGAGEQLPDHAPLLDDQGRAFLPASSIRGALRSQAERILRTIGGPRAACADPPAADGRKPCKPVYNVRRVATHLCPACQLFGAPGWKSPLEFSDFEGPAAEQEWHQDFVAIDRFTGGAADKKKFDARSAIRPGLGGKVILDLGAFARGALGPWALGLLALTLRDLAEGSLNLGFGGAKGYGFCRGTANVGSDGLANDWGLLGGTPGVRVDEEWIKPLSEIAKEWGQAGAEDREVGNA